jgi:hypothetical protein
MARLQLPEASDSMARWIATKELEHAVSMASLGPCQSKKYDTRFASTEWAFPVEL